jgi:RNA-binding protein 26
VPTIGPVNISWYAGTPVTTGPISSSASPVVASSATPNVHLTEPARPSSPEQPTIHASINQEEEVVASGWGGDGDGEDGMGML